MRPFNTGFRASLLLALTASAALSFGQAAQGTKPQLFHAKNSTQQPSAAGAQPGALGISGIRLKDLARFRGVRSNTLTGVGLVMGLNGTGDSTKVPTTVLMLTSFLAKQGIAADPTVLQLKNAAMVLVTAELPPFAVNGQAMDVTVTSMGDATSLRNGTLMMTEMHAAGNPAVMYSTAAGSISVGGYSAGAGGNSQSTGFVTVGRIPGGGTVEAGAPTKVVYDGKMFLELDDPDLTTAHRMEARINLLAPEFHAVAQDGGTVQVDLPTTMSATTAMARLEGITVEADTATSIVINEKTGTIVMGGDVRLSACAIATGSLSVKIEENNTVSQPESFSNGVTTPVKNEKVDIKEDRAQMAVLKPNTTIADLAHIFQELKLKPADIINIFQLLRQQGALKARVIQQ